MKRLLALATLLFLLSLPIASAAPSYIELVDAPTIEVDWSKGDTQSVTLGGNRVFTFSNAQKGGRYTLIVKQDASGSRRVTWPSTVHWPGWTTFTLTTTANRADYITFVYNGVSYDAVGLAQNL